MMKSIYRFILVGIVLVLSLYSCKISDISKINQFVAVCAFTDKGLSDGEIIEFKTSKLLVPSVSTILPSNISDSSAICGGLINDDGDAKITSKGICWSTDKNLTLDDNLGFTNEGQGEESFTSCLFNLERSTLYYVKAYAINEAGISYGGVHHFITD